MNDKKNITIGDVAEALGISKTTVSRAISGKGRIGESTRNMVLQFIEEHNYVPSAMARGLANQRTYNVGLIMPEDFAAEELPFFQKCLMGICEAAHERDYNVLITMSDGEDNAQLERMLDNRKIDGVLLARTVSEDRKVSLLKQRNIPFVTIGSCDDDSVIQVDNDNLGACKELTKRLVEGGLSKISLISGDESYVVNQLRRQGFDEAVKLQKNTESATYAQDADLSLTIDRIVSKGCEGIICMDDSICLKVLEVLKKKNIRVPEQIKLASFYGSSLLDKNDPQITSVVFDSRELGRQACRTLMDVINNCEYSPKTLLDYEIKITDSV